MERPTLENDSGSADHLTSDLDSALNFKPGDRVAAPNGKVGTVLEPAWLMPNHELISFDQGGKLWILRYLLVRVPLNPDAA